MSDLNQQVVDAGFGMIESLPDELEGGAISAIHAAAVACGVLLGIAMERGEIAAGKASDCARLCAAIIEEFACMPVPDETLT